jgi:hypothetical protein
MQFTLEVEREDDGRWLAEVVQLPGALAYGASAERSPKGKVVSFILASASFRHCGNAARRPMSSLAPATTWCDASDDRRVDLVSKWPGLVRTTYRSFAMNFSLRQSKNTTFESSSKGARCDPKKRTLGALLAFGFGTVLLAANPSDSAAATPYLPAPTCAWPFEWTAFGAGNWLWADTANRWWYMPIDRDWTQLTITGVYPKARFFSMAIYNDAPVSTGLAEHLYDAQIKPDTGNCNPFASPGTCTQSNQKYTMTITRSNGSGDNVLHYQAKTGWLLYRLYLPNSDGDAKGAVPLPNVEVTRVNGKAAPLPTCVISNRVSELGPLQQQFVPAELENPLAYLKIPPVISRIWFGTIDNPPARLLPNPDNKYLISYFMPNYNPGRLIVIRGKMPAFPDTYVGNPVSQPAPGFDTIQMRYWGACQAELVSPMPIMGCATDATTPLDHDGFYTIVITNDVLRPEWVPEGVVWLPWGDETMVPKLIFVRNLLSEDSFGQSVQAAIKAGCGFDLQFPNPPSQETIRTSGECAKPVMGDYYPDAVWCKRDTFIEHGWQACFE